MKNRVVFLGSKPIGYRCLEFLFNNYEDLNIELVGCFTNDNLRFDKNLSIRQLCSIFSVNMYNDIDDLLSIQNIDFIISVQYHKILSSHHIRCARKIAVNLHMAPLPEFRGCNQFSFAIYQEAEEFGATLHRIDIGIDSGDILFQERFPIPAGCNVKQLYDLTFDASIKLFQSSIKRILLGDFSPLPQSGLVQLFGSQIFYRKDIEDLKNVYLSDDGIKRVRATAMPGYEPPYALDGHKKIYLIPEEIYNDHAHCPDL